MAEFKKLTDEELKCVTGAGDIPIEGIGVIPPNINWPDFGACLLQNNAASIPALSDLVSAIRDENWPLVEQLAGKPNIVALPVVAYCMIH